GRDLCRPGPRDRAGSIPASTSGARGDRGRHRGRRRRLPRLPERALVLGRRRGTRARLDLVRCGRGVLRRTGALVRGTGRGDLIATHPFASPRGIHEVSATVGSGSVHGPSDWFLSAAERGNPSTVIDAGREPAAWTVGNRVEPLIHGADYFARLAACTAEARDGDELFVADWRGDEDELLGPEGPRLGDLLAAAARRGVKVRGLLWRSHPQALGFNQAEQGQPARTVYQAGGGWPVGERARSPGSPHQ